MSAIAESATKYLFKLRELSSEDTARVGGKAINESDLLRSGFLVPDSFVLSAEALKHFLLVNHIDTNSPLPKVRESIMDAPMPPLVSEALTGVVNSMGTGPFAVRSSAVAEDLSDASFAGQYETVLDVRGAEAIESAVRHCWASSFNDHVATYRREQGYPDTGIAVLIQKMVEADAAGVAFSANPVSGDPDEVVINAVQGLGNRLVSGETTPDEWRVRGQDVVFRGAPEEAITIEQVQAIALMARQVAARFGKPQDIEWALADGRLFVLQARAITTLLDRLPDRASSLEMIPIKVEVPQGFWQHDASHAPDPVYPMFRLLYAPIEAAVKRWFHEFGYLIDGLEFREIGGWVYLRMVPPGGKEPPQLPKWLTPPLMWLLVRTVPTMRSRIKRAEEAVRSDKPGRFIQRWYDVWQPELAARSAKLRDVELAQLADDALDAHLEKVIGLAYRGIEVHSLVTGALAPILFELVSTCKELLDWDEPKIFKLVNGTSFKSTEPARRLSDLAQIAAEDELLSRTLRNVDRGTVERLAKLNEEFAEAFERYRKEYGCRVLGGYGLANPTLAERPSLLLRMIHNQSVNAYDPSALRQQLALIRDNAAAEASALLAERPHALARFERLQSRAEKAYPVREDNEFFTLSVPLALIRYALLEVGARLEAQGAIDQTDDVFFLELKEARKALLSGGDYREHVRRRKAQHAWAEAHPGPTSYGHEPEPPSLGFLPREARFLMESLLWHLELQMELSQSQRVQAKNAALRGIAASPGQHTGSVRIIMNENEFHKLEPGDVLVCPATSPVWSVLFPGLGALVTDVGGILSHPAIIAREYQLPAVVALGNATSLLQDGQIVTVDGTTGTVTIVS